MHHATTYACQLSAAIAACHTDRYAVTENLLKILATRLVRCAFRASRMERGDSTVTHGHRAPMRAHATAHLAARIVCPLLAAGLVNLHVYANHAMRGDEVLRACIHLQSIRAALCDTGVAGALSECAQNVLGGERVPPLYAASVHDTRVPVLVRLVMASAWIAQLCADRRSAEAVTMVDAALAHVIDTLPLASRRIMFDTVVAKTASAHLSRYTAPMPSALVLPLPPHAQSGASQLNASPPTSPVLAPMHAPVLSSLPLYEITLPAAGPILIPSPPVQAPAPPAPLALPAADPVQPQHVAAPPVVVDPAPVTPPTTARPRPMYKTASDADRLVASGKRVRIVLLSS